MLRIEGAALEPRQIFDLTQLLEQAGEIRGILHAPPPNDFRGWPLRASGIVDLRAILRELRGKILPDGYAGRRRQRRAHASAAISRSNRSRFRSRWSGFCARTAMTARCRKISSPFATTASWFRWWPDSSARCPA